MKKKRTLALLLVFAMVFGLLPAGVLAQDSDDYNDIAGNFAQSQIEKWSDYGILQGNDGQFMPNSPITRAQMATVLVRLLSLSEKSSADFDDIVPGAWYEDALLKCVAAGVFKGNGDGTIGPDDALTREQAAVILSRAFDILTGKMAPSVELVAGATVTSTAIKTAVNEAIEKSGGIDGTYTGVGNGVYGELEVTVVVKDGKITSATVTKTASENEGNPGTNPNSDIDPKTIMSADYEGFEIGSSDASFTDGGDISDWAADFVAGMAALGFISGRLDGSFDPKASMTRAELIKLVDNIVKEYHKEGSTITSDVNGNLLVNGSVSLKGITIKGDLIISEGAGEVTLEDVKVEGRIIIRGGKVTSDTTTSVVGGTVVLFGATLCGTFSEVLVKAEDASVKFVGAKVASLTISGDGTTVTADSSSRVTTSSVTGDGSKLDGGATDANSGASSWSGSDDDDDDDDNGGGNGTYYGSAKGVGTIKVTITVSSGGKLTSIVINASNESSGAGYGQAAVANSLQPACDELVGETPKNALAAQKDTASDLYVDTVAGATLTSNGVRNALIAALEYATGGSRTITSGTYTVGALTQADIDAGETVYIGYQDNPGKISDGKIQVTLHVEEDGTIWFEARGNAQTSNQTSIIFTDSNDGVVERSYSTSGGTISRSNLSYKYSDSTSFLKSYDSDTKALVDVEVSNFQTANYGMYAIALLQEAVFEHQTVGVDAISNATYTSSAIKSALNDALIEAGASAAYFSAPTELETETETLYTDVVVVGAGGSGTAAAAAAAAAGAEVILLEKQDFIGGTTASSNAAFRSTGTDVWCESVETADSLGATFTDGVDSDSSSILETFWVGTTTSGWNETFQYPYEGYYSEDLIHRIAYVGPTVMNWLTNTVGANMVIDKVDTVANSRSHRPYDTAPDDGIMRGYWLPTWLCDYMEDEGGTLMLNTPATELIYDDETDSVIGVKAVKDHNGEKIEYTIYASAVVLATGGYDNNTELTAKYTPGISAVNSLGARAGDEGDAILMAAASEGSDVGAALQFNGYAPSAGSAGFRNLDGINAKRYSTPSVAANNLYISLQGAYVGNRTVGGTTYTAGHVIFLDDALSVGYGENAKATGVWFQIMNAADLSAENQEKADILAASNLETLYAADSISELIDILVEMGGDEAGLEQAVADYNTEHPDDPLGDAKVYAYTRVTSTNGTYGSLKSNVKAQVMRVKAGKTITDLPTVPSGNYISDDLSVIYYVTKTFWDTVDEDTFYEAIPGLYACGEASNGTFYGKTYPSGGSSLALGCTMGYTAGTEAAAYALNSGNYIGSAAGYGTVTVSIEVNSDSELTSVTIEAPDETANIGGAAVSGDLKTAVEALLGMTAADALAAQKDSAAEKYVDTVSGATLTSNGVRSALIAALEKATSADADAITPGTYIRGGTVTSDYTGYNSTPIEVTLHVEDDKTIWFEVAGKAASTTAENTIYNSYDSDSGELLETDVTSFQTGNYGMKAVALLQQRVFEHQTVGVDAISNATLTSSAVKRALTDALTDAGAGSAYFAAPEQTTKPARTLTYDVVVVGAGGAGTAAAAAAAEEGLSVLLLEKQDFIGGTTASSNAAFRSVHTHVWDDSVSGFDTNTGNDIVDSEDDPTIAGLKKFWLKVTTLGWGNETYTIPFAGFYNDALIEKIATQGPAVMDWLTDVVGVPFVIDSKTAVASSRSHRPYDMSSVDNTKRGYWLPYYLEQFFENFGGTLMLNTEATELITNEDGDVVGVKATYATDDEVREYTISAKAVVLATGGIDNNPEMLSKYIPGMSDHPGTLGARAGDTGDALTMAAAAEGSDVGAVLHFQAYAPDAGSNGLYNSEALKAMGLSASAPSTKLYISLQGKAFASGSQKHWDILDDALSVGYGEDAKATGIWFQLARAADCSTAAADAIAATGLGAIYKGTSIEDIAEQIAALSYEKDQDEAYTAILSAISTYNTANPDVALGTGDATDDGTLIYAYTACVSTNGTYGGLKTNTDAQVLRLKSGITRDDLPTIPEGNYISEDLSVIYYVTMDYWKDIDESEYFEPIPGLYAAGEASNGVFYGKTYPSGGSSLALGCTMGYTAGKNAAIDVLDFDDNFDLTQATLTSIENDSMLDGYTLNDGVTIEGTATGTKLFASGTAPYLENVTDGFGFDADKGNNYVAFALKAPELDGREWEKARVFRLLIGTDASTDTDSELSHSTNYETLTQDYLVYIQQVTEELIDEGLVLVTIEWVDTEGEEMRATYFLNVSSLTLADSEG